VKDIIFHGKFIRRLLMSNSGWGILILTMLIVFIAGCSAGDGPALPGLGNPALTDIKENDRGGTMCLGLWQVVIDKADRSIDAVKLREPEGALNVLGFMEPPALETLKIDFGTLIIDSLEKKVRVDVILQHPLNTGKGVFNGFDVRGIVFGPDVLNADGFTRWFNPSEFDGLPFGYADGLLGAPDSYANYPGLFNGFKYFASGLGFKDKVSDFLSVTQNIANRGAFLEGDTVARRYELSWAKTSPPVNFLVFNYAVYANYEFPEGSPPHGLDDFSKSANSVEAVFTRVTEMDNNLFYNPGAGYGGGEIALEIEVFDWQGVEDSYIVSIKSAKPDLIEETSAVFEYTTGPYSAVFTVYAAGHPDSLDDIELQITCTDGETYGAHYFLGQMDNTHLLYYTPIEIKFRYMIAVTEVQPGLVLAGSGNLPEPLPITDIKDFCVLAAGTSEEGVYYFGHVTPNPGDAQGEAIYKFPLDYSGPGTVYYDIWNPFPGGYLDSDLWGNETDLAYIDMADIGSGIFVSKSTAVSGIPPFLHRDWAWWFNDVPMLQNGCASPPDTAEILKWVDVSADYKTGTSACIYAIAITDELTEGTYPPPVETKVGFMTLRSPYTYPGTSLSYNYEMFERDIVGNVDGEVDDDYTTRLGVDGDPHGVAHPGTSKTVVYILESDPTPDIEVFELDKFYEVDSSRTYPITTIHGFSDPPTTPVDIECFPAYTLGFSDEWNWVAVLEDNGDGTWQVSLWEQNGAFVDRGDPMEGTPLNLDIDGAAGQIHVWFEVGSVMEWAKLEYIQ